jgi:hypothetical protein
MLGLVTQALRSASRKARMSDPDSRADHVAGAFLSVGAFRHRLDQGWRERPEALPVLWRAVIATSLPDSRPKGPGLPVVVRSTLICPR